MALSSSAILGQQIKASAPGQYDHVDDEVLGEKMRANPIAMVKFQEAMKAKEAKTATKDPVEQAKEFGSALKTAVTDNPVYRGLEAVADVGFGLADQGLGAVTDFALTGGENIQPGQGYGQAWEDFKKEAATTGRLPISQLIMGGAQVTKSLPTQILDAQRGALSSMMEPATAWDPNLSTEENLAIVSQREEEKSRKMLSDPVQFARDYLKPKGSDEVTRHGVAKAYPVTTAVEPWAEKAVEIPLMMTTSPGMGGLHALGAMAKTAAGTRALLASKGGQALTPGARAALTRSAIAGEQAGTVAGAAGASLAPSMLVHAAEQGGEAATKFAEGDLAGASRAAAGATESGVFGALGAAHAGARAKRYLQEKGGLRPAAADLLRKAASQESGRGATALQTAADRIEGKPVATAGAGDPALTGMRVVTMGAPRGGTVGSGVGDLAAKALAEVAGGAAGVAAASASGLPGFVGRSAGSHMATRLLERFRKPDQAVALQAGAPKELAKLQDVEIDRALMEGDMAKLAEASPAMAELQRTQQPGMSATGDFGTRPLNEFELTDATRVADEGIAASQAAAAAPPPSPVELLKQKKAEFANRKAAEEMEHLQRVTEMADKYGKKVSEVESLLKNATYEQAERLFAAEQASKVPPPGPAARRAMVTEPGALSPEAAAAEVAARDPFQNAENIPAGEVGARLGQQPRNRFDMTPEEQQALIDMIRPQEPPIEPPPAGAPVPAGPSGPPPAPAPAGAAVELPSRQMAPEGAKPRARKDDAISDTEKLNHPVFEQVMAEYEAGTLKSSNGKVIPAGNDAQARAIARSMAAKAIRLERERAAATEATTAPAGPQAEAAWQQIDAIVEKLKGNVGAIRAYATKLGVEPQMIEQLLPEALKRYKEKAAAPAAAAVAPAPRAMETRFAAERAGAPDLLAQMRAAAEEKLGVQPEAGAPSDTVTVYRGSKSSSSAGDFWTTDKARAEGYAEGTLESVEVPRAVFEMGKKAASEQGQPTTTDTVLPSEYTKNAKAEVVESKPVEIVDEGTSLERAASEAAAAVEPSVAQTYDNSPRAQQIRKAKAGARRYHESNKRKAEKAREDRAKLAQNAAEAAPEAAGTTQKPVEPPAPAKAQETAPEASKAHEAGHQNLGKSIGELLGEGKVEEASAKARATAEKPDGYAKVDGKIYKVGEVLPDGRMVIDDGTLARPRRSVPSESPKGPRGKQYSVRDEPLPDSARPRLYPEDIEGMLSPAAKKIRQFKDATLYADGDTIIATVGGKEVGFAAPMQGGTDLTVVEGYQRQGIGTELLREFKKRFPDQPTGGLTEAGRRTLASVQAGKQYSAYRDVKRPEPLIWANRDIPGERFKDVVQYRLYGPNKSGEYTVAFSGGVGNDIKPLGNFKAKSAAEARELATKHFRDNYKSDGYTARRSDGKGGMEIDTQYSIEDQFSNQGVKGPKSAARELLRLRTAESKKDIGPPEPKGKLTPPDPRTERPFADDYLSIEDLKRSQPISKGERYTAEKVDVDYVEGSAWKPPTLEEVRTMLPKGLAEKTFKMEDGSFEIDTPRGRIRIEPTPEIRVDLEALEKGRPGAAEAYQRGELSVPGEKTTFGGKAVVRAVEAGVLPHEVGGHVWFDHFASKAQREFLVKKFNEIAKKANQDVREAIADAYSEYHKRKLAEPGWEPQGAVGKFVKNIYDFMASVYHSFRPSVESTFESIRTGKEFEKTPDKYSDTGMVPGFRPQLADNAPPAYGDKVMRDTRPYRTSATEPQLVAGGSAGKNVPVSKSGEPAFTLKATPKEPLRILMPDGSVKKLPIRGAARLMGVPDEYPLPANEALARTILGNGVPPPLMKKIAEPMLKGIESPKGVSLFSGGGVAEQGLKGGVEFIGAVEFNKAIADHYRKANGDHIVNDDVRNVDFTQWEGADYLHASPVCKNFSGAKAQSGEVPLDIETAKATARAIDEIGPKVVTVENVPGYMGSEAMKIITEQLTDLGYKWDAKVYDAADYGVPQTRKRMILRAVKNGELPPTPPTETKVGWWNAVKDLPMEADKSGLAAWQKDRMHKQGNIQLESEKYAAEGPKPLRAAVGSMLKSAENVKHARPGEKGLLETQKTDLTPRLAKKNTVDEPIFDAKAPGTVQKDGVVMTKGAIAPVQYSVRTNKQTMETARRLNEKAKVFTKEQLDKFERDINSVAAQVLSRPESLDYVPVKGMTSLKANGDSRYPKSLDFTTSCKRRYALAHTIDAIQERTGKLLEAEDVIKVRKALEDKGVEVNCGPCYVDSRRINMATAINKAIQGYEMKKGDQKGKVVKLTPENAKLAMTQEGRDKMFETDPEQYAILSQAFAGTQIKIPVGRAEYKSEIAELPQSTVDAMNKYSGMRSQSWSDFEVPHLLDKMQAVLDQSLRKLKGQSYTKEIDYVETMKDTGEMINMSLIPDGTGLDANGRPLWKTTESIRDMARARQIRKKYDNVGFEGIGISDEHIKALLADPEVDYVIPYHSSGLRREFQDIGKMRNWKDYTKEQSWRDAKTGEKVGLDREIFISEWQGDLKKLDKLAKERGVIPPFERFRNLPGYEKLLTDRRIWGNNGKYVEQQPMQFKFDMDHVNKLLKGYKGGADKNQADLDVVGSFTGEGEGLKKLVSIGDIDVATRPGGPPLKLPAFESGVAGLAITKVAGDNPGINLTHTASGMSFGVAVPKSAEKVIKQFAKDVYDIVGDDIKTPDFFKRLTSEQKQKLNALAKDLTRNHGVAATRRNFLGRTGPKPDSVTRKLETMRKELEAMVPKTGDQLRELAKNDPVGYSIEQAVNYGFDNMHRVAAETDIGKEFGGRTPLEETYKGGYVPGPHKYDSWAGLRKPLWAGSLTHHGQLMVSRSGNLYDAAIKATRSHDMVQSRQEHAAEFVKLMQAAEKGDTQAIERLKPFFKSQIQQTIAHELLHGFRDTRDSTSTMQMKMNASADKLLDTKTKAGTTLREELSQYFDAKSMDASWAKEIQARAKDVLKIHGSSKTSATMLKKLAEIGPTEEAAALNAGRTAISRGDNPSSHARVLEPLIKGKTVLDWGQGKGADVKFYGGAGAKDVKGWDPNHQPDMPKGKFDVVTNTFVGNVLPPQLRHAMWTEALGRAKEKLFIAVRSEKGMQGEPVFDGVLMGKAPKKGAKDNRTFQKFYKPGELVKELKELFPGYEIEEGPRKVGSKRLGDNVSTAVVTVPKETPMKAVTRARGMLYGFRAGERRRELVDDSNPMFPSAPPEPKAPSVPGQLKMNDVAVGQQVKTDDGRTGVILRVPAGFSSTLKVMVKFGKSLEDLTEMHIKDLRYVK